MLNKYSFKASIVTFIVTPLLAVNTSSAQKKHPGKLLPDHMKIQYGGGMGFISFGLGYTNKTEKLEGDIYYGYVPESIGGVTIHSISGKLSWVPIHPASIKQLKVDPLVTGLLVNYSFGKQYFSFDPPNYPYNYYSFPTAIHAALFFGSRISVKRISLYYEIVGFDRDMMSYLTNSKSLQLTDVFTLSAGIKVKMR